MDSDHGLKDTLILTMKGIVVGMQNIGWGNNLPKYIPLECFLCIFSNFWMWIRREIHKFVGSLVGCIFSLQIFALTSECGYDMTP